MKKKSDIYKNFVKKNIATDNGEVYNKKILKNI